MEIGTINKLQILLLSIFSFIRFGIYIYWIYWFNEFILPIIFITPDGLFILSQIPIMLAVFDLISVLIFLSDHDKTWFVFLISIFTAIGYSWINMLAFTGTGSTIGVSIIAVSVLQFVILLYVYFEHCQGMTTLLNHPSHQA